MTFRLLPIFLESLYQCMLRTLRIPIRHLTQTSCRPLVRPPIQYRSINMSAPAGAPAAAPAEGKLHKDEVTGEMISKGYVHNDFCDRKVS
jgi:hypothetical protein